MDIQLRVVLDDNKKLSGKIQDSIYGLGKGLPYSITALIPGMLCYVYITMYVDYQRI
ncbi:hypothetical protein DYBT9275_01206 [Dyadobacter sp. CECT 9275]|uniref:Uncharacterized protein n=1 Tax=Dyadobacter helix TaxID=2822344 RepID=A0A916JA29_9BACT|nr:hypothetical protein DYBT9275_01206 [Dyadobacter sp. CECT 9275]